MTPHHLHALAAAWSLHTARQHLAQHARDEAAQIAAERLNAADGLRSPAWGRRHALGGHGDPTATTYLTGGVPFRVNRPQALADDITGRLSEPARHLPGTGDPLDRITDAIPAMSAHAAERITTLLVRLDERVRRDCGLPNRREEHLVGVECPACRHRTVYLQPDDGTVVCRQDACRCTGQGCRCGMPGAVEGVAHIWPRAAVIAGATYRQETQS